ncbi:MAG: hypothetical protein HY720_01285 [Planctomycetes bacterium]|nr:hypothetical protein [Planctomycetota bacterium]
MSGFAMVALGLAAVSVLAQEEGSGDTEIGRWIEDLRDADPNVRDRATKSLEEQGASAKSALLAARQDPDPEVRGRVDLILERVRRRIFERLAQMTAERVSPEARRRLEGASICVCFAGTGPQVPLSTVAAVLEDARGGGVHCSEGMKCSQEPIDLHDLEGDLAWILDRLATQGLVVQEEREGGIDVSLVQEALSRIETLDFLVGQLAEGEEWNACMALDVLVWATGQDLGFDWTAPFEEERRAAASRWRAWLDANRGRIRWDERNEMFVED